MNRSKIIIPIGIVMLIVCVYSIIFNTDEELVTFINNHKKDSTEYSSVQNDYTLPDFSTDGSNNTNTNSDNSASTTPNDAGSNIIYTDNLAFNIHSISKTKYIGNANSKNFNYSADETINDMGNLTSADTYIFMDITIQNMSDASRQFNINSINLYAAEGSKLQKESFMRYLNKGLDVNMHDYFEYTFSKNEKVTFTVGFITKDAYINEYDWILAINPAGNLTFETTRLVPIKLR